uniref:Uncharacterized protein n=1 Tax=Arundo donax TaxID=35708 RepID=A0A0A9E0D4_ARUDO
MQRLQLVVLFLRHTLLTPSHHLAAMCIPPSSLPLHSRRKRAPERRRVAVPQKISKI